MRYRKPIVLYLVAAIVAVIMSALGGADILPSQDSAVHANGFTVPLVEGDSGPCKYLVGIWPAEPVVGNLHMAIALTSEQGPVTGAAVESVGASAVMASFPTRTGSRLLPATLVLRTGHELERTRSMDLQDKDK